MSLALNGIEFMMVSGDQRNVEPFCQRQRKGVGKGDSLFDFNHPNPLDEYVIGIATEEERQEQGVRPRRLSCSESVGTEKVIVDLAEITDMHSQKGSGLLDKRFEHFRP